MEILDSFLEAGANRTVVPLPLYIASFSIPTSLLALLISAQKVPAPAKQILSVPLLAAVILTPIQLSTGNGLFDVCLACGAIALFMRLFELFWITPILYGRASYASRDYLYTEFWASMCRFPKHNKKKDDDATPKEYIKNKKAYHLILYLAYHLLVVDVICSWFVTFTGNEVITLQQDRPAVFLLLVALACHGLNSGFNILGYSMQLFHCLYYDRGSYSDEQWHPLIQNPLLSTSLQDLWSFRWHQLFHTTWVALGFRPTRFIMQRLLAKSPIKAPTTLVFISASLAVFLFSGLTHEYMIYTEVGWSVYSRLFCGQQLVFFVSHGVGMMTEQYLIKLGRKVLPEPLQTSFFVRQIVSRLWITAWAYYTFKYFISGFAYSAVWHDSPLEVTRPYVLQLLRNIPNSEVFCGSLL